MEAPELDWDIDYSGGHPNRLGPGESSDRPPYLSIPEADLALRDRINEVAVPKARELMIKQFDINTDVEKHYWKLLEAQSNAIGFQMNVLRFGTPALAGWFAMTHIMRIPLRFTTHCLPAIALPLAYLVVPTLIRLPAYGHVKPLVEDSKRHQTVRKAQAIENALL